MFPVIVIVVVPFPIPVTFPFSSTVAIESLSLENVYVSSISFEFVIFIVSLFRKNKIVFRILSIVAIICSLYGIYKTVFIVSALSPFHNYLNP